MRFYPLEKIFNDHHFGHSIFENLKDDLLSDFFHPAHMALNEPATNIYESENQTIFKVAIPGIKKNDLTIELNDGLLKISGKKEPISEEAKIIRQERPILSFSRSYRLPKNTDESKCKASYEDGILTITLEKSEKDKPKIINIQ